jgi:hypothetical protein
MSDGEHHLTCSEKQKRIGYFEDEADAAQANDAVASASPSKPHTRHEESVITHYKGSLSNPSQP